VASLVYPHTSGKIACQSEGIPYHILAETVEGARIRIMHETRADVVFFLVKLGWVGNEVKGRSE